MGTTFADGLRPILQRLEATHGPRQNWPTLPPSASPQCERCQDQGWMLRPEPNPVASVPIYRAVRCPACVSTEDEDLDESLWRLSGVSPQERRRCTLATFQRSVNPEMASAFAAAAEWGQGKGPPFLLLSGPQRGLGKTHLALAAARECIARGCAVRYVVVPRLLDELRATQRPQSPRSLEDARRPYEVYPAVILDDLGAGGQSDWAQGQLFDLVNERWRQELRTLVTSNVRAEQLEASTFSRLADTRLGRVVFCRGKDYRRLQAGS